MSESAAPYFPPPEIDGGWRWLKTPDEIQSIGGMDLDRLEMACDANAHHATTSSVVIIRHGHIVAEWLEISALTTTRYDIWSATKSFTGTAYGLLFEDSRKGRLPGGRQIDLDTPAYEYIPEGHPLTDPRKANITFRHLLSMTSGIPGSNTGIAAIPTDIGVGPFEAALGLAPCKARRWSHERWASTLTAEPGTNWDYSDPAMAHLALAFFHITGREMDDVLQERVFGPVGVQSLVWDRQGVGKGFIGPHTNAHTGIHVSAREFARIGYLMLHNGNWNGQQILPRWWIELETKSSQDLNPAYGFTWWVNSENARWPGLPRDMYAAMGLNSNRCYVIPSLDMVVARTGFGPLNWDEPSFISSVLSAVTAP